MQRILQIRINDERVKNFRPRLQSNRRCSAFESDAEIIDYFECRTIDLIGRCAWNVQGHRLNREAKELRLRRVSPTRFAHEYTDDVWAECERQPTWPWVQTKSNYTKRNTKEIELERATACAWLHILRFCKDRDAKTSHDEPRRDGRTQKMTCKLLSWLLVQAKAKKKN